MSSSWARTAKGIIYFLIAGDANADNEEARKIYVGARAERQLTTALPGAQAERLRVFIASIGAAGVVTQI
jgi:hypothetical protein